MPDDIENLYSKVNNVDRRVSAIEAVTPLFKEMIEKNADAYNNLTDTLQKIQVTMEGMNNKIDVQTRNIEYQSNTIVKVEEKFIEINETTNKRIDKLNEKVEELEEKGKFDIQLFLKKNWPWITVIIGFGIYAVSNFIKF